MITRELLRDKCLKAFQNYTEEAGKTCGLLGDLEDKSVPLDRLLALLAQTQAEDQAQEAYLLLRQQLFEVLEVSTAIDKEPAQRPQTTPAEQCSTRNL